MNRRVLRSAPEQPFAAPALETTMDTATLEAALRQERIASYIRLRGGFPVPMAGCVYWAALGGLGYRLELETWAQAAFLGSGAIFPLALLFAAIFKNPFMKDRTAVSGLLLPAFLSMLLFWAVIAPMTQEGASLIPLGLAVGMSIHWPVIGWMYGRTAIYAAHAVLRAVAVVAIWLLFPEQRLTWLPLSVAAIYALTVAAILIDSGRLARAGSGLPAGRPRPA